MSERPIGTRTETAKDYESRLLRVLTYIDDNLGDTLKLEDLAAVAYFSPFHFHRIFKGMIGETLGGYIRRRRLERAADRLLASDVAITDLALDAGFENSESFSRAFKGLFGVSPSHYRRSGRPGRSLMTRQALQTALLGQLSSQAQALSRYMETEGRQAMFDVKIKPCPAMKLAYIRHNGPYMEVGPVFDRAMGAAGQQGLFDPDTQVMALYYDDPNAVEPSALRSDVGLSIAMGRDVTAPLKLKDIDAGDYGVAIYKGSYEGLQGAYDWLYGHWLPQSGREATDKPCMEIYLTDPDKTKPEENLTEIRIPLG